MNLLALILMPLLGFGTWECTGPEGGEIKALVQSTQDAGVLFAVSGANPTQVVRSSDGGDSWETISEFSGSTVYDMVMTADGKLVAVGSSRTWTSTDGGLTWTSVYMSNTVFWDAVAHPTDGNRIFASGYKHDGAWRFSFYESTDGGTSWSSTKLVSTGSYSYGRCIALSTSNPNLLMAGGYEYTGSAYVPHLMYSTDSGSSWSDITPSAATGEYYFYGAGFDPVNPDTMFAGSLYSMYMSTDAGTSWTKISSQVYNYDISFSQASSDLVMACGSSYIYRSADGGSTWTTIISGLSGSGIQWITPDRTDAALAYTGSSAGFFRSENGGSSWSINNTGLILGRVLAMEYLANGWMFMNMEDLGMWKALATGPGMNWVQVDTPLACGDFCAIESNPELDMLALEGGG